MPPKKARRNESVTVPGPGKLPNPSVSGHPGLYATRHAPRHHTSWYPLNSHSSNSGIRLDPFSASAYTRQTRGRHIHGFFQHLFPNSFACSIVTTDVPPQPDPLSRRSSSCVKPQILEPSSSNCSMLDTLLLNFPRNQKLSRPLLPPHQICPDPIPPSLLYPRPPSHTAQFHSPACPAHSYVCTLCPNPAITTRQTSHRAAANVHFSSDVSALCPSFDPPPPGPRHCRCKLSRTQLTQQEQGLEQRAVIHSSQHERIGVVIVPSKAKSLGAFFPLFPGCSRIELAFDVDGSRTVSSMDTGIVAGV